MKYPWRTVFPKAKKYHFEIEKFLRNFNRSNTIACVIVMQTWERSHFFSQDFLSLQTCAHLRTYRVSVLFSFSFRVHMFCYYRFFIVMNEIKVIFLGLSLPIGQLLLLLVYFLSSIADQCPLAFLLKQGFQPTTKYHGLVVTKLQSPLDKELLF